MGDHADDALNECIDPYWNPWCDPGCQDDEDWEPRYVRRQPVELKPKSLDRVMAAFTLPFKEKSHG